MASNAVSTPSTALSKAKQPTFIDWLKPRRGVAITRLKNNGFAMVIMLIITQLLPIIPSPLACLWMVVTGGKNISQGTRVACWIGELCCPALFFFQLTGRRLELAILAILSANIAQAYLGLKYPPPPCDPMNSPAKRAQLRSPPPARPMKATTSFVRLSFISTMISDTQILRLNLQQTPQSFNLFSSSFAQSPLSTSSRIINYKPPASMSSPAGMTPFGNSLNSSTQSSSSFMMSSPLAYRSGRPSSTVRK